MLQDEFVYVDDYAIEPREQWLDRDKEIMPQFPEVAFQKGR